MNQRPRYVFAALCGLMVTVCAVPASAQMSEVKEKPPMYSYVANWQIPRAHWAEVEATAASSQPIMDKALADGTIVGYGNDEILVHRADGETHDIWWSAMSMAGLIKVLEQVRGGPAATSSAFASATKHWDEVFVSRYYNWHPGSWKSGYGYLAMYKLKADAPADAVDTLSKHLIAPLLEKMLADGTILEYEVDTEAIHTDAPGDFGIIFVAPKPEGVDTVLAAIRGAQKDHPLSIAAFGSMEDNSAHRDQLLRGNGTYK